MKKILLFFILLVSSTAYAATEQAIITDKYTGKSATVIEYAHATPVTVRLSDTNGDYVAAGAGTQYTDGGTPPAHPVGPELLYNNGGVWQAVSAANPLPVQTSSATGATTKIADTNGNVYPAIIPVTLNPGITGGWSSATESTLSTVAQQVKGSAGTFGGYTFYNPNSTVAFLQVFDTSTAAGATTTTLKMIMGLPATSAANMEWTNGINMTSGIYVAASNTPNTITSNTIPLQGSVVYK